MGLTLHYEVSYPVKNRDVVEKMESVRQKCLDLPFAEVSEVQHLLISQEDIQFYHKLQRQFSYPNNTEKNLALRNKLLRDRGLDIGTMIFIDWSRDCANKSPNAQKHEIVRLNLWAGNGCESTNIILAKNNEYWSGTGFTKTQYAEEFVKCHLLVIKAFDLLKEAGFKVNIHDEGHYWETRDIKVLAKNINDYTMLVKSLFGSLNTAIKESNTDMTIQSPISHCENYMKVDDTTNRETK